MTTGRFINRSGACFDGKFGNKYCSIINCYIQPTGQNVSTTPSGLFKRECKDINKHKLKLIRLSVWAYERRLCKLIDNKVAVKKLELSQSYTRAQELKFSNLLID